jgi:hypothetical protein
MYLRFTVHKSDDDSGRRQGIFIALEELRDSGLLLDHEQREYERMVKWFNENLEKPKSFSRSSRPHAKRVALSWYKDTAIEHIARMHTLSNILEAHGILVDVLSTERPGYVVYEDLFQVTAEPFKETVA